MKQISSILSLLFFFSFSLYSQERKPVDSNYKNAIQIDNKKVKKTTPTQVIIEKSEPVSPQLQKLVPSSSNQSHVHSKSQLWQVGNDINTLRKTNSNKEQLSTFRKEYLELASGFDISELNEEEKDIYIYCLKEEQPEVYETKFGK